MAGARKAGEPEAALIKSKHGWRVWESMMGNGFNCPGVVNPAAGMG